MSAAGARRFDALIAAALLCVTATVGAAGWTSDTRAQSTKSGTSATKAVAPKPAKPRAQDAAKGSNEKTQQQTADAAPSPAPQRSSGSGQAILVLVNDEPITAYEVEQRQRLLGLSAGDIGERAKENLKRLAKSESTAERWKAIQKKVIEANRGKSREEIIAILKERQKDLGKSLQEQAIASARASVLPALKKKALDEIIDERLKLQEAKRLNLAVTDADVDRVIGGIAERNKMTIAQFGQHIKSLGADISTMRAKFRATLSWNEVIRRRFGAQVAINDRDIDRFVAASPGEGEDQVELQLQRVTFAIASKADQAAAAQKLQDAEAVRQKFTGCPSTAAAAGAVPGAKFEDVGTVKPATIAEPTRTMLLEAKDGEMLPPTVGDSGVELWVVCSRKTVKVDEQRRSAAQDELRQREFELLAQRHLKDLRQDATIEYRAPELR